MDTMDKKEDKGRPCETDSVQELTNNKDVQCQNAKQGGCRHWQAKPCGVHAKQNVYNLMWKAWVQDKRALKSVWNNKKGIAASLKNTNIDHIPVTVFI